MESPEGPSAPKPAPASSGLARAEQHLAPPVLRSTSRLGFAGVFVRRLVARLTRFQTAHQAELNQGVVAALRDSEAEIRELAGHLGNVSRTLEAIVDQTLPAFGNHLGAVSKTVEQIVGTSLPSLGAGLGDVSRTVERIVGESIPALGNHLGEVSRTLEAVVRETLPRVGDTLGDVSRTVEQIVGESMPALGNHLGEVSRTVEKIVAESMPALGDHLGEVSRTVDGLTTGTIPSIGEELRRHGAHSAVVSRTVEQLAASHGDAYETQRAQGRHLDALETRVADFGERLDIAAEGAGHFEDRLRAEAEKLGDAVADLENRFRPHLHFDQFDFARKYRGDEEELTRRFAKYAVLFGPVSRVLDVGCGRGEFLQACREAGIGAYGVEADPEMVSRCTMKALEVATGDALAHLRALPDRSLDGIFSAQVIEHLTNAEIVELIHLAADKLKRGALIVLETINPDTFSALRWFWMDPTHRQPVSPATVRFLLEESGFTLRDVLYSSPVPEDETLARLSEAGAASAGGESLVEVVRGYNRNIEKLNRVLFGDQDYAVIAER